METTQFNIKAHTYRIMASFGKKEDDDKSAIIDGQTLYNIPVYQREFSWGEEQISKFISDLFNGFWGVDEEKIIRMEPMFIGTMQLSYKKHINTNDVKEQDVIDGQQRLSTILCILKYLQLKFPQITELQEIPLNWLKTRVNNGKENDYLLEMLSVNSLESIHKKENYAVNTYLRNLEIVKDVFHELTIDEEYNELVLFHEHIYDFIHYFLNNIYFVVVETLAGLSKTIQIFNTINTAGLDLNGNDLFKVRLYEYLHDICNQGEEAFDEISDIYKNIKVKNSEWRKTHDWNVFTMDNVRSIYQDYLIAKYKLNVALFSKATDTFFEELFDTLLNVNIHKEYAGVISKDVRLSLDDIKRISEVAYLWNTSDFHTENEFISYILIDKSRYSRYMNIAYQVLLTNEDRPNNERFNDVYALLEPLSKLFFCYSILYAKSIYEIHSFMHVLYQDVYNYRTNKKDVIDKIYEKIKSNDNNWFREECIGKPIAWKPVWKNLICLLSDYLEEIKQGITLDVLKELYDSSDKPFDIEHIHANANPEDCGEIDEDLQNSIGNLMLLEYDINRSIGCQNFNEKINQGYKESKYATVKKVMKNEKWTLEEIKKRREEEINIISKYLFEQ